MCFTYPQGLLAPLMEQSPEEVGDLYLDVGEAYLEQGEYPSALPLLSALVISEKYNLAVVWLRHAGGISWEEMLHNSDVVHILLVLGRTKRFSLYSDHFLRKGPFCSIPFL